MPIPDFMEAMAFYSLWPFGEVREDIRMAVLASTVANASGHYRRTMKPEDFMLFKEDGQPKRSGGQQTPEEIYAAIQRFQANANAKALKKKLS